MKCIYLGSFPPPYGGVTIKNNMLFNELSRLIECEKLNLTRIRRLDIIMIIKFIKVLFNRNCVYIIGTAGTWRRKLSQVLYYVNKKALSNSILIVMGGKSAKIIAEDKKFLKYVSKYKKIYVEANGMKKELEDMGLSNVDIFPNCRSFPNKDLKVNENKNNLIKLVYFSQISEEKGADLVIESAKILDSHRIEYEIDFYGPINDKFKENFFAGIDGLPSIKYCGVFKADKEDVYERLNQYDVLLFPTRWKHEGVPGILVESKIAGLPAIVSDINFNSEIINNNVDGLVLERNSPEELASQLEYLSQNRNILNELKINAKSSSDYYLIDKHIYKIVNEVKGA